MGDMADMALEAVEDSEMARSCWRGGQLSEQEAYDAGIIDELGFEYCDPPQLKTCKHCGKSDLKWGKVDAGWRLFDGEVMHQCKQYRKRK